MAKVKKTIVKSDFPQYPLGINKKVDGPEKRGNYVYFFIDPTGNDPKKGRSELVGLKAGRVKICI